MNDIHPGLAILREILPDAHKRRAFITDCIDLLENEEVSGVNLVRIAGLVLAHAEIVPRNSDVQQIYLFMAGL